jgi:hypothetical protein
MVARQRVIGEGTIVITYARGAAGALVGLVLALLPAGAGAQMPMSDQTTLTPAIVESFIASYPVVRETTDSLSQQYGIGDSGDDPSSAWQAWLGVGAAQGALNAACQSYGFQDFGQWVGTFVSIATAYAFAKEGQDTNAEMQQALADIQNSPNLSDAQKAMMVQQMQAVMGMMGIIMPPQENVDAVRPYIDQLTVLFDEA